MTTRTTQPPATPGPAVTPSSLNQTRGRKGHLSVVRDPADSSTSVSTPLVGQWPILQAAARQWAQHRPSFNPGKWDDRNSLAGLTTDELPDFAATQIRHFGTTDSLPGLDAQTDLRYRDSGYRKLVDEVRDNDHPAATWEAITHPPTVAEFGNTLEIRTLRPGADKRLEFTSLSKRFAVRTGARFALLPVACAGASGLALVLTSETDDGNMPMATLLSKGRLAFNTPARSTIEVTWDLPYEDCEFTVIGPGVSFVAAILPPTALPELLNQQIERKKEQ